MIQKANAEWTDLMTQTMKETNDIKSSFCAAEFLNTNLYGNVFSKPIYLSFISFKVCCSTFPKRALLLPFLAIIFVMFPLHYKIRVKSI